MAVLENIEVLTQSCIRIRSDKGIIYLDPFRMGAAPHDADYIFVTHDHYDHFSPEDIEKASSGAATVLIVPEKLRGAAGEEAGRLVGRIETVKPGEQYKTGNLEFETVPAYNNQKSFHPKSSGWVGYILQIEGKRIYIAGDTDATKEAETVECDIALVPIGGTYTMDAKQAAEFVNKIRPEVAIPTHYGSIVGRPEDEKTFAKYVKAPTKVEFKIPF